MQPGLGYQKEEKTDVDLAKNLLIENNWELKNNVWIKRINQKTIKAEIDLVVNVSNPKRILIAETIKQQLEEIGILIQIRKVEEEEYRNRLDKKIMI